MASLFNLGNELLLFIDAQKHLDTNELKQSLQNWCTTYLDTYENSTKKIAKHLASLIPEGSLVGTYSFSQTVYTSLLEAYQQKIRSSFAAASTSNLYNSWTTTNYSGDNILKMDLDEAMLLCNCNSLADVLKSLSFETTQIVAITLGSDGCVLKSATHKCRIPGFSVKAVDTTGCGDAFMAALIDGILSTGKQPRTLSKDELYKIGCRANAAGAFTAMHYGAMSGLPTVAKLNKYIQSNMKT